MARLVLGEADTNFIVESDDDDELGPALEQDMLEKVARVVRNSYEFAEDEDFHTPTEHRYEMVCEAPFLQ